MLVVIPQVTQAVNDQQQVVPMLERVQALPAGLNQPEQFLADTGYFSADHVAACEQAGIEPLIAVKREHPHPPFTERCGEPEALPAHPTPVQRMQHRLKTGAGRAAYALRKQRVEPVFGIIKSVLGQPLRFSPAAWTRFRASGRWRGISNAWPYGARSERNAKKQPLFYRNNVPISQQTTPEWRWWDPSGA